MTETRQEYLRASRFSLEAAIGDLASYPDALVGATDTERKLIAELLNPVIAQIGEAIAKLDRIIEIVD